VPVLLVHGPVGIDHTCFRPWLDPLGERAELVYYDQRGNGASDEPADWSAVDLETFADDAERLRQHLGRERVVLFGHSLGVGVALEYALRYPERVRGLVLCAGFSNFAHAEVAMENARRRGTPEQLAALSEGLSAPIPDDATLRRTWKTILPLYFHRFDEEFAESFLERTRFRARAFNRTMLECVPAFDVQPRLGEIGAPTLLLAGAHDWICPPDPCLERLGAIPGSKAVVFRESGHFPFVEEQAELLRVVGGWLDALRSGVSFARG
jgi:proline iminopeptidase